MTIYSSQQISAMTQQGFAMAQNNAIYAQQLSGGMYPGQPPMAQRLTTFNTGPGQGGMYGEQMAGRMASAAGTMGNVGAGAFAIGGGMGMLGMGGAAARFAAGPAALAAIPLEMGARMYGGAFMGGMQDQTALNSTLRNNFQHFGGQGAFGRGFSQSQMGQIGSMISGEVRRNPFANAGEMNQLIAGGAEAGLMSASRDVQSFTQQFRKMLDTLKSVQRELGGTLTDALQFVRGSQQAGIFQNADKVNFAAEIRGAEAVTGIPRQQLMALATQGAQMSQAIGGYGRQGAAGIVKSVQQIGAALQTGALTAESIYNVTGLQGQEGIQAYAVQQMQHTARFTKRAMGRYSLFAMSNAEGTGLDQEAVERFATGDISRGDISQMAHSNIRRMGGRLRAINQEGVLRGAMLEEGGMAGQIGIIRSQLGEKVLNRGDDYAELWMQRRMGMSREESRNQLSMIRNAGSIIQEQRFTERGAEREQRRRSETEMYSSWDGFSRQLSHGFQEGTGMNAARDAGRNFVTKLSSVVERVMNDMMGATSDSLSRESEGALNRLTLGRASSSDIERLTGMGTGNGFASAGGRSLQDRVMRGSVSDRTLRALGVHAGTGTAETISAMGYGDVSGMSSRRVSEVIGEIQSGRNTSGTRREMERLSADTADTNRRIMQAQMVAAASGTPSDVFRAMGVTSPDQAAALHQYMQTSGMASALGSRFGVEALGGGGDGATADIANRFVQRQGSRAGWKQALAVAAGPLFNLGMAGRDLALSTVTDEERRGGFLSRGGRLGASLRARGASTDSDDIASAFRWQPSGSTARLAGLQVKPEDMMALAQNDSFASKMRHIASLQADGKMDEVRDQLDALTLQATQEKNPGQAAAMRSVIAQAQDGLSSGNKRINSSVLGHFAASSKERDAFFARRMELSMDPRKIARDLEGVGGALGANIRTTASRLAQSLGGGNWAGQSQAEAENQDFGGIINALGTADISSEEYGEVAKVLRQTGMGGDWMRAGHQQRELRRELGGRGRRGGQGQMEAALGLATGGGIRDFSFTGRGGRALSTSQGMRQLWGAISGGGSETERTRVTSEFLNQLTSYADDPNAILSQMEQMRGAGGEGGRRVTERESTRLMDTVGRDAGIQRHQQAARQTAAEQNDPLGTQRNALIKDTNRLLGDHIGRKLDSIREAVRESAGQPQGE